MRIGVGSAIIFLLLAVMAPLAQAQDELVLTVWYTLDDAGPVLEQVSAEFEAEFGATVNVQYIRPQQLFDLTSKGGEPDVILASSDDIGPLIDNNLVADVASSQQFFLGDVLDSLPDLIDTACPEGDIAGCLWPRVSPTLNVTLPDSRLVSRTESWLCSSAEWMPLCPKGNRGGVPLTWWFNVYLISDMWLAENGLYVPVDVTGIDELRSEYGLDYTWARDGSLPDGDTADAFGVYIFPSTLLVEDPQGMMRSMGSFDAAGFLPVLELGIDSLYISASSPDPALALEYVEFVSAHPSAKVDLMDDTNRLPALDAAAMGAYGLNTPQSLATLRAATILTAYTQLVN